MTPDTFCNSTLSYFRGIAERNQTQEPQCMDVGDGFSVRSACEEGWEEDVWVHLQHEQDVVASCVSFTMYHSLSHHRARKKREL